MEKEKGKIDDNTKGLDNVGSADSGHTDDAHGIQQPFKDRA
jgi:hypothetical protein